VLKKATEVNYRSRTILRTKDGQVVVRPEVDEQTICHFNDDLMATFTSEGAKAWNAGNHVGCGPGHFNVFASKKGLARANFN